VIQILDASTLLNLANGEVLSKILQLPGVTFQVSAAVQDESRTIAKAIDVAVASGHLALVDSTLIAMEEFECATREWQLGSGETECILAARVLGCSVACDDKAARNRVSRELGEACLSGSIGLLRTAVKARVLTSKEAFLAYELMLERGAFLPVLSASDF
jgi:predicted nucleic acid-binding protein